MFIESAVINGTAGQGRQRRRRSLVLAPEIIQRHNFFFVGIRMGTFGNVSLASRRGLGEVDKVSSIVNRPAHVFDTVARTMDGSKSRSKLARKLRSLLCSDRFHCGGETLDIAHSSEDGVGLLAQLGGHFFIDKLLYNFSQEKRILSCPDCILSTLPSLGLDVSDVASKCVRDRRRVCVPGAIVSVSEKSSAFTA
jgi:hypothetical protein